MAPASAFLLTLSGFGTPVSSCGKHREEGENITGKDHPRNAETGTVQGLIPKQPIPSPPVRLGTQELL